jgi:tetratricopeptide (TPR) repeat protein
MILRLSDSLSRGLVVAAALCVAASLSFFSIRMALAAKAADERTAEGLRLAVRREPLNAEYWYRFGHFQQFNLEETDPGQAKDYFKKAIAIDPKYTDAWLDLGTAYELEGNMAEAKDAYLHAKQSYPASPDVSWRYGNFLLREGNLEEAYPEFRLSLISDPGRAASAFSRCYRANPNVEQILDQMLPPIAFAYVGIIKETADTKQVAVSQIVWRRLLTLHPRLTVIDFEPLVAALLVEGDVREAHRVWEEGTSAMKLPELGGLAGSLIWDPSFESGVRDSTFSWRFQPLTQGLTTALDSLEKRSGNLSLRLTFDGKHNPNLDAACIQAAVSPSTNYDFSAWVKTRSLTTDHGIGFHIHSYAHNGEQPIQFSREISGTNPWTSVDFVYTTGLDVYKANICIFRERNLETEERIAGTAWIDDVNLVPKVMEPGKP